MSLGKNKLLWTIVVVLLMNFIIIPNVFSNILPKCNSKLCFVDKWFALLDYDSDQSAFDPTKAQQYDMAIFDPDYSPMLEQLKENMVLIAYLSVGEAEDYRSYWEEIKNDEMVVGVNKNWAGNYFVDVRSDRWHSLILDRVIPEIIAKGFNGLMLDTLDTVELLENDYDGQYQGAKEAMVDLVKKIHEQYPSLTLISNGGFVILNDIAPFLSGMLVEDIFLMIDFENNAYRKVSREDRESKLSIVVPVQKEFGLPVFNIEYVDVKNAKVARWYFKKSKKLGFKPYVAEKDLDLIYEY